MAITPKRLVAGTSLTTAWTSLYFVPATVLSATAKQLVICNTDNIPRTIYYAVTPTSSEPGANAASHLFHNVTLQANETKVFGLTDVMPTGYYIYGKTGEAGNGNYVAVTVSGMETT